jgi:hypothetical protein
MKQHELMGGSKPAQVFEGGDLVAYRTAYRTASAKIGTLTGAVLSTCSDNANVRSPVWRPQVLLVPTKRQASDWWDVGAVPFVGLDIWLRPRSGGRYELGSVKQNPFRVLSSGVVERVFAAELPGPRKVSAYSRYLGFVAPERLDDYLHRRMLDDETQALQDIGQTIDEFPQSLFLDWPASFVNRQQQARMGAQVLKVTGLA